MNKLFTLCLLLMVAAGLSAQNADTFKFADSNGNILDDEATVSVGELVEDEFMGNYINSGLSVKNTSQSEASIRIAYEIETLDNGSFQICFPENCISKTETGSFTTTKGEMTAGELRSLQCEWFPNEYGTCKARLTIEVLNGLGLKTADGPSVNVVFSYLNVVNVYPVAWWGYVDDSSAKIGLGVKSADTYHCAIFIPGNHTVASGKTINAIRFGLVAPNATNVKVWTATSKPTTLSAKSVTNLVEVPASSLGEDINVPLPKPYAIPKGGVYVGYSFTITKTSTSDDQYPVLTTGIDAPNALLLRTESVVPEWSDLYGQGYGSLFLQVLLQGEFEDNIVTPADFGPIYAETSKLVTAKVSLANNGATPVSEIDYTITTDGANGSEYHATLENPIPAFAKRDISLAFNSESTQSKKEKTLTITKVNGYDNGASDKSAQFTMYSLSNIIGCNVVVEQFTGTGCGWCPRGHVGMANLRAAYGDRFIGIALHQYSTQGSDAMYIASNSYAKINFEGAPSCRLNRGEEMDPYYGLDYYGISYDFEKEMAIPAIAAVEVSGTFNSDYTKVDAQAAITPMFDDDYSVEFVLVADGLKGTGSGWNQANYYSSSYANQTGIRKADLPDDLKFLYDLGTTFNPTFNDVAIASSYSGGKNKVSVPAMSGGETSDISYTLSMPTYTKLKNALKRDEIYVIAILIGSDGRIVNAAKAKVGNDATGVDAIRTVASKEAARYTLDGRQVSTPHSGISIIRMSDGSIRKVIRGNHRN